MTRSTTRSTNRPTRWPGSWTPALAAALVGVALVAGPAAATAAAAEARGGDAAGDDDGEYARKHDLLSSPQWRRAVAELGAWLSTQTVYPPAEVRRIKARFNDRVAGMSSYELEYLVDSIEAKVQLLDSPQARDAKVWLGEYLSAMSDARRAEAMRGVPDILEMSAEELWREIQRIDSLRASLERRQQGVESRQAALAARAGASREATAAASRAAAARPRPAPAHSPYRSGSGSAPFANVQQRRMQIVVGVGGAGVF